MSVDGAGRRRVAIVTGGGAGIGAAIAEELGRTGAYVVTMDPLVAVDGSEQLPADEETTAGRIVAAGGAARASSTSVTDADGVRSLFAEVAEEFGGLDAVINVAGITRPTSFTRGTDDDWRSVLSVHLDGYRNVLDAALSIMAAAGRGHILGVTSGSGWRPADTGAYGCAKRAVASLTWQMGRHAPPGVVVNAISPIAMTRMVTAALSRRKPSAPSKSSSTGGLSLGSMPTPEQLGPLAAHLVHDDFDSCHGQVLFAAGSELAIIERPRLLEVFDAPADETWAHVLEAVTVGALLPAESAQVSKGGSNPRFGVGLGAIEVEQLDPPAIRSCLVVSDRDDLAAEVIAALEWRGVTCRRVRVDRVTSFETAAETIRRAGETDGSLDGVVLALADDGSPAAGSGQWQQVLSDHARIVDHVHTDAAWARAVADHSHRTKLPMRLATVTDATSAGGRSRAQSSAQLARASFGATESRVVAFPVGVETRDAADLRACGALVAHLLCSSQSPPLSGAEFVVAAGTIGLRSHPAVGASVMLASSEVPAWFDVVLEEMIR